MPNSCCSLEENDFLSIEPKLEIVETLLAESHYSLRILRCPECDARFVKMFSEQIAWTTGEDPMECVIARLSSTTEKALHKLGPSFSPISVMGAAAGDWWKMSYPENEEKSYSKGNGHFYIIRPE